MVLLKETGLWTERAAYAPSVMPGKGARRNPPPAGLDEADKTEGRVEKSDEMKPVKGEPVMGIPITETAVADAILECPGSRDGTEFHNLETCRRVAEVSVSVETPKVDMPPAGAPAPAEKTDCDEDEDLIQQCAEVIRTEQSASINLLQWRLRLGYGCASRIMEELERRGLVGPAKGTASRDILMDAPTPESVAALQAAAQAAELPATNVVQVEFVASTAPADAAPTLPHCENDGRAVTRKFFSLLTLSAEDEAFRRFIVLVTSRSPALLRPLALNPASVAALSMSEPLSRRTQAR